MLMLVFIVFLGVFALAAPLTMMSERKRSAQGQQATKEPGSDAFANRESTNSQTVDFRKQVTLSAIPWIHRWLLKFALAPRIRTLLSQANLKWTVGGLFLACSACFVVSGYLVQLRTGGVLFPVAIGLFASFAPIAFVLFKRSQRFGKFEEALPEALDLMVSALRVGQSLQSAIGLVARECPDPVSTEFRACFDEQNYGLELRTAMNNLTTRVPLQDLRIAVTGILIQKESGGNLAEVLDKTASVIRERFRIRRQIRIHTAQGRLTGAILTFLPLGLGVAMFLINPVMMSVLWTRPLGVKLLWASAGMLVTGTIIIQKIIRMDV